MMALDFAPVMVSIITQFFLPIQNPRMDCSAALLSIGTSPSSRNTSYYSSRFLLSVVAISIPIVPRRISITLGTAAIPTVPAPGVVLVAAIAVAAVAFPVHAGCNSAQTHGSRPRHRPPPAAVPLCRILPPGGFPRCRGRSALLCPCHLSRSR